MSRRGLRPAGPPQECWGQSHAASAPPEACLPSPSRVHGRHGAGGLLPARSLEPGGSAGAGYQGNSRGSSPEPAEWAAREPLGSLGNGPGRSRRSRRRRDTSYILNKLCLDYMLRVNYQEMEI